MLRLAGMPARGARRDCKLVFGSMRYILRAFFFWLLFTVPALAVAADATAWTAFKGGLSVLLIRHALAPGGGDPANFDVSDCTTQRNLDDTGRAQARAIGDALRRHGVTTARVWSSQWCRCLDTARLLKLGPVNELFGLNSFYELAHTREPNLRGLRAFLKAVPRTGAPIILVTHFVTIGSMTGQSVGSGEGVLARIEADGALRFETRVSFR